MHCSSCGTQLREGAAYCPICGAVTPYRASESGRSPYDVTVASAPSGAPLHPPPATDNGLPPYGVPQQNPYTPVNPYEVPLQPPPPPPPRRRVKLSLLIGVGVLVLLLACVASVGVVALLTQPAHNSVQGTTTPTTSAAPGTKTVTTAQNPYPPYQGTLALNDSLRDNSSNNFGEGNTTSGATCQFKEGAYHVSQSNAQSVALCYATSTDFSNFVFEVQMTIIKGDVGGIIFRGDGTNDKFYYFFVGADGTYGLLLYIDSTHTKILRNSTISAAINRGLNQTNLIAMGANGNTITLYINHQQMVSVNDSTYSHGQIGFIANPYINNGHPTEVAFSNAKVWTLV